MSSFKQIIVSCIFSKIQPHKLCQLARISLLIPYYHMINDNAVIHTKYLYRHKTSVQFSDDLDFLMKYFTPITLFDLIAFSKGKKTLPQNILHLTFDDGFREMHDIVAPILLQKGIPATFFINSDFTDNLNLCYQHKASILVEHINQKNISLSEHNLIENLLSKNNINKTNLSDAILAIKYKQRNLVDSIAEILDIDMKQYLTQNKPYLTTEQISSLIKHGFTIGAHSIDHPLYKDILPSEQLRQTLESISYIKHRFNLDYGAFAFPHSDVGVHRQYFDEIDKSTQVDISFGTAGLLDDCTPHHFQRFSLEKQLLPAKYTFAYHAARKIWRSLKNTQSIIR